MHAHRLQMKKQRVQSPVWPLVLGATLRSLHWKYCCFIYESIHLQQSEFYGNLPFTVLMTLQQSVVAERGRELGGFPSERAESILLGKGAKSVVMPDSIFWVIDIQELHLPFHSVFLFPNITVLQSATCKWILVQSVWWQFDVASAWWFDV